MAQVRTRDESIALADSALAKFDEQLVGLLTQATAITRGACGEAEVIVGRCANKVQVLVAALAAATQEDQRRLQAEAVRAQQRLEQARRAARQVADVAEAARSLERSYRQQTRGIVSAGRGHLSGRAGAIQQYRSGGGLGASGNGGRSASSSGSLDAVLSGLGMGTVDVAASDFDDLPVHDHFSKGGTSLSDYRWAVQTWYDTVGPGVARGMRRDDFAALDARNLSAPFRRTADVYDLFMGSDRIRADRRQDGSLNVVNGRHRLSVARDLGIPALPGEVHG